MKLSLRLAYSRALYHMVRNLSLTHTCMHAYAHTRNTHTHTHNTHTRTHAHTQYTRTHTHTYIHTPAYMHTHHTHNIATYTDRHCTGKLLYINMHGDIALLIKKNEEGS